MNKWVEWCTAVDTPTDATKWPADRSGDQIYLRYWHERNKNSNEQKQKNNNVGAEFYEKCILNVKQWCCSIHQNDSSKRTSESHRYDKPLYCDYVKGFHIIIFLCAGNFLHFYIMLDSINFVIWFFLYVLVGNGSILLALLRDIAYGPLIRASNWFVAAYRLLILLMLYLRLVIIARLITNHATAFFFSSRRLFIHLSMVLIHLYYGPN